MTTALAAVSAGPFAPRALSHSATPRRAATARVPWAPPKRVERPAWHSLLHLRSAGPSVATTVAQHACTALGQACLVGAAAAATAGQLPVALIAVYIGTWAVGNALHAVGAAAVEHWQRHAYSAFVERVAHSLAGRTDLWSGHAQSIAQRVGAQGRSEIENAVGTASYTLHTALGLVTQGVTLACLVNPWLGAVFLGSCGVSIAYTQATRARRATLSSQQLETGGAWTEQASQLPDRVMLPNAAAERRWRAELARRQRAAAEAAQATQACTYRGDLLVSACTALPTAALLCASAARSPAHFAATVASAREITGLFSRLTQGQHLKMMWDDMRTRLRGLLDDALPEDAEAWARRLERARQQQHAMSLQHEGRAASWKRLQAGPAPGLWTVRGANGAGKTTVLDALALSLPRGTATYLPARPLQGDDGRQSTGERALAALRQIEADGLPKVVLLDECDSHLDADHRKQAHALIAGWAQRAAVVQVLHQREAGLPSEETSTQ